MEKELIKKDYIEKRNGNRIINYFTKTHTSSTLLKNIIDGITMVYYVIGGMLWMDLF